MNKTLMRVSEIASKGDRVVFDDDGNFIEDTTTGEGTWMTAGRRHVLTQDVGLA